ncbi:MAG: hypothetical protein JXA18_00640 [Chitinispirillaceae bacterium]|nr:hypothetical protein [Chitinispirillaceae bacterium]
MKKNRWYDKHEGLANHLEALKILPKRQLNELLKDLIAFARLLHPTLFEDHLFEYPLDLKRRRWYDDDPYLWLVVNGLRFTDDEIIRKVVAFFDKQIGLKPMKPSNPAEKTTVKKASAKKSKPKKSVTVIAAAKKRTPKRSAKKKPLKK